MSQSIPTGYIPPGSPRGLAQKIARGWEFEKGGDYVKIQSETFCPCIGFIKW